MTKGVVITANPDPDVGHYRVGPALFSTWMGAFENMLGWVPVVFNEYGEVSIEEVLQEVVARNGHEKEHQVVHGSPSASIPQPARRRQGRLVLSCKDQPLLDKHPPECYRFGS